jgi:gliding motility-associated-like protein
MASVNSKKYNTPNIPTTTYLWSTGAISERITIDLPGVYTVDVTNVNCTVTKTITVIQIDNPIINTVVSNNKNIIVSTSNTGDFLFSLNGNSYQSNNTFFDIDGGSYSIYIKSSLCDTVITAQYLHFYIPNFFTPNEDRVNDIFDLKGIEVYNTSDDPIFNRYGKLIKSSRNTSFSWDWTFNSQQIPTDDYWYTIVIDGQKFTGHFTLKR